jgi:hypothetical protein
MSAVQRRVRGDRRATSVPLIVFGLLTVMAEVSSRLVNWAAVLALFLLAPLGFLLVVLIFRRREISLGVGARHRGYLVAALITLLVLPVLGLLLGEYAFIGCALLVIAALQRNLQLAIWAVAFGVIGGLERFYFFSNRLYSLADAMGFHRSSDGYFSWGSALVYGALGVALIGGGLFARHGELSSG